MSYPETLSELTNYPKALSHAGTGGGDFTTAKVTITGNGFLYLANIDEIEGKQMAVAGAGEGTVTAILVNGKAFAVGSNANTNVTIASGAAEDTGNGIIITGDCNLRVTQNQ